MHAIVITYFRHFVSNLSFELFLLLHKTDCREYKKEKLLENRIDGTHSYVENCLRMLVPTYKKGKVNFLDFRDDIEQAIQNHRHYATTLSELKHSLGSNLPQLLEDFIDRAGSRK